MSGYEGKGASAESQVRPRTVRELQSLTRLGAGDDSNNSVMFMEARPRSGSCGEQSSAEAIRAAGDTLHAML